MPFIVELADGTLPQETFQYYLIQDLLYLQQYSRVLSMLSSRMEQTSDSNHLLQQALGVFECEANLHKGFLQKYGISPETVG